MATIDDLERSLPPPLTRLSSEERHFGTSIYDLAIGREVIALGIGVCPQCGEAVERDLDLSDSEVDYYNCIWAKSHRFMVNRKDWE